VTPLAFPDVLPAVSTAEILETAVLCGWLAEDRWFSPAVPAQSSPARTELRAHTCAGDLLLLEAGC
jgi:hypothetical protein